MLKKTALAILSGLVIPYFTLSNNQAVFKDYSSNEEVYFDNYSSGNYKTVNYIDVPFILNVYGECVKVSGNVLESALYDFNADILWTEDINGGTSYYCYSKKLKYGVTIKGKTVNLHIHIKDGYSVMASPLIFGSY